MATEAEIWAKQRQYDELAARRAEWVAEYDKAPDGSAKKRLAIRMMDRIGDEVRVVEKWFEVNDG